MTRKFTASIKEYEGGQPWIVIEPDEDNGLREGSSIVIDLPPGASYEDAKTVARTLNDNAENVSVKSW